MNDDYLNVPKLPPEFVRELLRKKPEPAYTPQQIRNPFENRKERRAREKRERRA